MGIKKDECHLNGFGFEVQKVNLNVKITVKLAIELTSKLTQ